MVLRAIWQISTAAPLRREIWSSMGRDLWGAGDESTSGSTLNFRQGEEPPAPVLRETLKNKAGDSRPGARTGGRVGEGGSVTFFFFLWRASGDYDFLECFLPEG